MFGNTSHGVGASSVLISFTFFFREITALAGVVNEIASTLPAVFIELEATSIVLILPSLSSVASRGIKPLLVCVAMAILGVVAGRTGGAPSVDVESSY